MTTKLYDLFDLAKLDEHLAAGMVRQQVNPSDPWQVIFNYTEKAQFANAWDEVTLQCRGLIVDTDTMEVIARPFPKFFNHGDTANTGPIDMRVPVTVTDKLDGSLGISYWTHDGPAIATRGSFTSEQAIRGTQMLRDTGWEPTRGTTALFEIVYPENRIVVDYGDTAELFLLAILDIEQGRDLDRTLFNWPGRFAEELPFNSWAQALAAPPRPNAEGMVVFDGRQRVKVKQDDYVRLHRIITGLNARTVWEWLGDGKTVGDLCATLPDDFHDWVVSLADRLTSGSEEIVDGAFRIHTEILDELDITVDEATVRPHRAAYARAAAQYPTLRPYLFLILDGRHTQAHQLAWQAMKPSGAESLVNHSEAVA